MNRCLKRAPRSPTGPSASWLGFHLLLADAPLTWRGNLNRSRRARASRTSVAVDAVELGAPHGAARPHHGVPFADVPDFEHVDDQYHPTMPYSAAVCLQHGRLDAPRAAPCSLRGGATSATLEPSQAFSALSLWC